MSKPLPLSILLLAALVVLGPLDVAAQLRAADPLPVTAADGTWGRADAPVTLMAFTDLECPFCKRAHGTLKDLKKQYGPSKLRIVYKNFPLAFHKRAKPAAEIGVAVHMLRGNKAFESYLDATFVTRAKDPFAGLAAAGIGRSAVERLLKTGKPRAKVERDMALGKRSGVRGTPAFFVNGIFLSGARPQAAFSDLIDQQLIAAAKLRGTPRAQISRVLTRSNFKVNPAPSSNKPKTAAALPDDTVWKVPVGASPQLGPRGALVTMVVFSDFQCPFCSRMQPTVKALHKKYPKDLRIVFKHNPLPFHKRAEPAAQLAIHAFKRRGNAGFWAAHDVLFGNQKALTDADLEQYARELKLNPAMAMQAVNSKRYKSIIDGDQDLASDVKASGTPTSFVNGRKVTGARPLDKFSEVIDAEIVKAKALRAKGVPAFQLYKRIIKDGKSAPIAEKRSVAPATRANPSWGNARAKVTIQMFTDFRCPFCSRVLPTLEALDKEFPGQLKFVYRHKPLPFHKQAPQAHNAAAEAFAQGGNTAFWRMHDWLFANQKTKLDTLTIVAEARKQGLDPAAMTVAIDSLRHKASISRDIAVSDAAGIRGTPGFMINDYFLSGAQPLSKFKRVVQRAMRDAGVRRP